MTTQPATRRTSQNLLLALLLLIALAVSLVEAYFISRPGTMDSCYYYSGGWNLIRGLVWKEFFLWNYLDESAVLPHPGNMYWMPLPSLLAAAGMLVGGEGFRQAQIPLVLLATGFPFLVFFIGKRLTDSFRIALLAGFFSIASGFYTLYWLNTESFLAYAWIGGLIFLFSPWIFGEDRWMRTLMLGALCGLAHLTRADGVVFLGLTALLILIERSRSFLSRLRSLFALGLGYLLTSGIWYFRNLSVWHSLFPPGTEKAAWLTEYNDLFLFPSSGVTLDRFFSSGLKAILHARWEALQANTMTVFFVLGLIFLFPLMAWGMFLLRRKIAIRTASLYLLLIFLLMTFLYPFQGSRGGLLHSTSALLSVACLAASVGLDDVLDRLCRWRKWNPATAKPTLGAGMAILSLIASAAIYMNRVMENDPGRPYWAGLNAEYERGVVRLGEELPDSVRFMVNNPPCFYVRTGLAAVPIPAGDLFMLLEAADQYDIHFVILDANTPDGLQPLYRGEQSDPRLKKVFAEEYDGILYVWYEVLPPEGENNP